MKTKKFNITHNMISMARLVTVHLWIMDMIRMRSFSLNFLLGSNGHTCPLLEIGQEWGLDPFLKNRPTLLFICSISIIAVFLFINNMWDIWHAEHRLYGRISTSWSQATGVHSPASPSPPTQGLMYSKLPLTTRARTFTFDSCMVDL